LRRGAPVDDVRASGFGENFVQKLDQFPRDPILLSGVGTGNTDHFGASIPVVSKHMDSENRPPA
jgi:hypothetical protein